MTQTDALLMALVILLSPSVAPFLTMSVPGPEIAAKESVKTLGEPVVRTYCYGPNTVSSVVSGGSGAIAAKEVPANMARIKHNAIRAALFIVASFIQ